MVNRAEPAGQGTRVPGDRPGSARRGHAVAVAGVRPAEHHPEIHPGHVALAATAVTGVAVLGAAGGAGCVVADDVNLADAPPKRK